MIGYERNGQIPIIKNWVLQKEIVYKKSNQYSKEVFQQQIKQDTETLLRNH